jgi:CBS domain-containing protein
MGGALVLELDDLLPIVDAGKLLGFITVEDGDLALTPLGRAYADTTILARKAIIAGRVLRLPLIAWIYETLQQDDNQRVAWDYFHDKLEADFGDDAEKQLDIVIGWGRHAELFAYDNKTAELFLEPSDGKTTQKSFALAELYEAWPVLSTTERVEGFKLLDLNDGEDFFLHLASDHQAQLTLALPLGERKFWLCLLSPEKATEIVQQAVAAEREGLLALLDDKTRREVHGLLDYASERSDGKIHPLYVRLRPEMSVDEAVSFLRRDTRDRSQTIYYAYLTDLEERLLGIVSFRDLLTTAGDKSVNEVMRTDLITAPENADEAMLNQLFTRHNLAMIPLVDGQNRIKRVITKDKLQAGSSASQ